MANALYDKGREAFLAGDVSWRDDDIKVCLVDTDDYTVDLAADEFLSDIPSVAIVATSGPLTNKTVASGVADADDVTFSLVTGDECEALIIYQDTGTASTSRLLAYIDSATGLPVTPNGTAITLAWSDDPARIFKL